MMKLRSLLVFVALVSGFSFFVPFVSAATVEYELTIAKQEVDYTGNVVEAMTVNGGIPGPVLRFTDGDFARIKVHNRMDVETSIHWHGLLVPPGMDGVPLISFPPIAPGTTFVYEFPIRQSGTYWYHSHTGLQEQRGVYGSIVISPDSQGLTVGRDHVVLLSDWTDEDPHQVLRTLKRGSEWYALEKGSAQSIFGAMRKGMLGDYMSRELQRMPAMDIADVAYDRFLVNGDSESTIDAEPGDRVRLRIIDGSATTFFHVEFAGGPLQIVAADGQDVEPVDVQRLLIGVAETYDVVVSVPASGSWELRTTAHDGSGYASVWIGRGQRHKAPDMPMPNLYAGMGGLSFKRVFAMTPAGSMGMADADVEAGRFDQPGMAMDHAGHDMHEMATPSDGGMDHSGHNMHGMKTADGSGMVDESFDPEALFDEPDNAIDSDDHAMSNMLPETAVFSDEGNDKAGGAGRNGRKYGRVFTPLGNDISAFENLVVDGMDPARPWPPYERLRAIRSTALSATAPVRTIRLTLDGDMERYVWFLNNRALSESDDILIRKGETVRFIMINRTMMHHPMHLHGHFFRVINKHGDYSPLKHTVDVAPMSTTVIEFNANEVGDWFFHCHLLYHMKAGMARAIHYESFGLPPEVAGIRPQLYKDSWYAWGEVEALSHMAEGSLMLSNTRNILSAEVEVGWRHVDPAEWEALLLWNRYINRFAGIFAGANIGDAIAKDRGVLGLHYLLPFNIETRSFVATDREVRVELEKEFQLLPRLRVEGLAEYETGEGWEYVGGLTYDLGRSTSLRGQWHSEYRWGGGIQVRF